MYLEEGFTFRKCSGKTDPKERRGMLQREVRQAEEEDRHVKAVAMNKARQLDKIGEGEREASNLAGHQEHGRPPDKVPDVFCI